MEHSASLTHPIELEVGCQPLRAILQKVFQVEKRVLVVDDEPQVREALKLILSRVYQVEVAAGGAEALKLCSSASFDLVLVDLMMPDIDGLEVLKQLKSKLPSLPVIMLTASSAVKSAVEAMRLGAVDYLNKPYDVEELLERIESTLGEQPAQTHHLPRPELPESDADFGALVGSTPHMKALYSVIGQLATKDITVLITGESGVGKELIAREIHRRSPRSARCFIAVNCAALTAVEAELFGTVKGTVVESPGLFESADGGTLFLDEISELRPEMQAKILRFIETGELYRVGAVLPTRVDVRVITATNTDLEQRIERGEFRRDLYFRLNVVQIQVPTLKERIGDLPGLVAHFVSRMSSLYGRKISFNDEAMQTLMSYSWPGNVRELENLVESLLALAPEDEVSKDHLPLRIQRAADEQRSQEVLAGKLCFQAAEQAFETDLILKALRQTNWVQTRAAELLGISRRILKYKMDKLGIPDEKQ